MRKTPISEDELVMNLIEGWSERYGKKIDSADVQEINKNLSSFVTVMEDIDSYLKRKKKLYGS